MRLFEPSVGPLLGARTYGVEGVEQRVLVRGKSTWAEQTCFFRMWSDDGRYGRTRREVVSQISPSQSDYSDVTHTFVLDDLSFDTKYSFRIGFVEGKHTLASAKTSGLQGGYTGTFKTSNPNTSTTSFVFGSCCHLPWSKKKAADDAAFKSIQEQWKGKDLNRDDFILMLGDQIYGDHVSVIRAFNFLQIKNKKKLTFEHYLKHYRKAFGRSAKQKLMSSIPTYMTFDDHEVHNDWGTDEFLLDSDDYDVLRRALRAYNIYQVSHPDIQVPKLEEIQEGKRLPDAKYFYDFSHGKSDFFVMDARYERSRAQEEPLMISLRQEEALRKFLDRGSNRVKFIASSVPFFPDANRSSLISILDRHPDDRWQGYAAQRKRILDMIKRNIREAKNPNVILLSGDVHVSYVSGLSSKKDPRFKTHQITSSAFNWGLGLNDKNFAKSTLLKGTDDEYLPQKLKAKYISDDNYCRVVVKTNRVDVRFHHAKTGKIIESVTLDLI